MTLAQKFNCLNGNIVSRIDLEKLLEFAQKEQHSLIEKRITKVLDAFAGDSFAIEINSPVEPYGLSGVDADMLLPTLEYISEKDNEGLGKAVSPNEIYDYITNLILNTIDKVGHLPWQKEWKGSGTSRGAKNYVSDKEYTGANFILNFDVVYDENGEPYLVPIQFKQPYYLTFNQIKEANATLNEGAKARRVIYYTLLFSYSNHNGLAFKTTDKAKWIEFIKSNNLDKTDLDKNSFKIPIIKYYNLYRADHCTGLKFKEDNTTTKEVDPIDSAQAIIDGYPNPPRYTFEGDKAVYYPMEDRLNMPSITAFSSEQFYYATYFHEAIHSTGHSKRLNRGNDTRIRDGSKEDRKAYAFEELVAELGAVFLCGESGILFHTKENSAKYLKGWNNRLVDELSNDNRFFLKASAQAQKGANHILGREKEKEKEDEETEDSEPYSRINKKASNYGKKKAFVSKKNRFVKPFSVNDIPYNTAYHAYTGTSFSPEKRAENEQKGYVQFMEHVWEQQMKIAEKNDLLSVFEERFLRFKEGYLSHTLAYLKSRHGLFSTMIAGSSNFPVARMRKKNAVVDSRLNALVEYGKKYQNLFAKELKPVIIKTGSQTALSQLEIKLKKEEEQHQRTLDFNAVMRKKISDEQKKDELLKKGFSQDFIDKAYKSGFTTLGSYVSTNALARIRNLKAQIELEKKLNVKKEEGNKEKDFDGGKVVWNYDINRLQLLFEDKPNEAIRTALKRSGLAFKWSPKEGAWQRQLNTFDKHNWKLLLAVIPSLETKAGDSEKKESSITTKGLNAPKVATKPEVKKQMGCTPKVTPEKNVNKNSLAYKMANRPKDVPFFNIDNKDIADFLGQIERKEKESIVISLTGGQGSMKTRMCFQFMNALAQFYKVGHASIEEHPESSLYYAKAEEYLNAKAVENIECPEVKSLSDLEKLIQDNEIIVIDSFSKMQEMCKGFEIDKDLRKKYNGKLFIVIFQLTTDGKMRGGSKSQFDADIVLFTEKMADYRDNYIYADKNRYQNKPLDGLKFNIFNKKLIQDNPEAPSEPRAKKKLSFLVN
ncbi:zincin-like metallopeptidase domain-containing protein [Flavobacterium aestivum]|uniref:zincin-like metallopeptidase domain-containing protein n=1 Tax=Flavobacterium aestivum TaxID=3003257 RepID=UPI002482E37F|nr:zincin-like metallopeptidase domain-containing protein [Flavobacterium aestivum]